MKNKRILAVLLLLILCFALTACSGPEGIYKQAQDLLSKGKYAEAAEKFESIGSYEEASTLSIYCKACALCESGDYDTGIAAFENLGAYKDSAMRITYYTARSWDDNSINTTEFEWMEKAVSIYKENPLYLDSLDRIAALEKRIANAKEKLYNDAVKAGDNGDYSTARSAFDRLGKHYRDSEKRYTYYGIRSDEAVRGKTNDPNTLTAIAEEYMEMVPYLDCSQRATALKAKATAILDAQYAGAIALKDDGKYVEAIAVFKRIQMHRDSAAQIKACEKAILDGELDEKYDAAVALKNAGKYEDAIAAFTEIQTHRDSAAQIKACETEINARKTAALDAMYDIALAMMKDGGYAAAYDVFFELGQMHHKDSAEKASSIYTRAIKEKLAKVVVGDYVTFGAYEQDKNPSNGKDAIEWLVLAKEDNRLLVISKCALDCKPYNTSDTNVTWETCTLRKWLNNDFVNAAFSSDEKAMIPTVTVSADKNPYYSTNPGNATRDQVFLLSIQEVNQYFTSDIARKCTPTAYAWKQGTYTYDDFCLWWLRSPGFDQGSAARVRNDGGVDEGGAYVNRGALAVRPALWIDLNQ